MSSNNFHDMLSVLCPMHLIVNQCGTIAFAGPTARKLLPEKSLLGRPFLEVFDIKRPRAVTTVKGLRQSAGTKLHLAFRAPPQRELKGILVEGPEPGQMIVNLSFGIFVVDAIQDFGLTAADFAATDLTIEMLYLVEAKSAAMDASRQLNHRLQNAREAAETQALTDTLTGLSNRRAMDDLLSRLTGTRANFALMHVDLDFFKAVNDTLGHAAGDHVLLEVARIMQQETRSVDTVARVGGDEFVIVIREVDDRSTLKRIAERLIARVSIPMAFGSEQCRISASIGIVVARDYAVPTADLMLGDADAALYASKRSGRGRHTFFAPAMRLMAGEVPDAESDKDWSRSA